MTFAYKTLAWSILFFYLMKMYCLGYLNIKGESFGSQSSLATSGSNTSGSQTSKDLGLNSDNKVWPIRVFSISPGYGFLFLAFEV